MVMRKRDLINSALARLFKRHGAFAEVQRTTRTKQGSRTFQGRPVVKIMWHGEEVDAVQGVVAYCVRDPRAVPAVMMPDASAPDQLGIGILDTGENADASSIAAAAKKLGPEVLWTE